MKQKQISVHNRNTLAELFGKLNDTDSALAANPECVATQNQRDHIKIKIELLKQQKSRAAQVCSWVKLVEEGGKNTKYFLEKSRANSKIMERVTDEMGQTITKQADIMNVQKDFFSDLYKKKIHKEGMEVCLCGCKATPNEGMEENNNYFYGKYNTNNLCSTKINVKGWWLKINFYVH